MQISSAILLILLFFLTSVVGVVTGSNSLITVPVMFQFGIDEKVAVATNMFGLVFMAVGGTIPFIRAGQIDYRRVWPLAGLTVVSSAIGAALVGFISGGGLKLIVSIAMIAVSAFIVVREQLSRKRVTGGLPNSGTSGTAQQTTQTQQNQQRPCPAPIPAPGQAWDSGTTLWIAYALTFLLGIYGGLYSGGYVTMLTATLIAFYGLGYTQSIAATKIINVFSSLIATLVFMWQGLVDYKLGLILGISMFVGAYAGAHFASRMNEVWLRRIFLSTVILLALKTLYELVG